MTKYDTTPGDDLRVDPTISRDQIAEEYFALLPFQPYPVQEEALLAYFTSDQGDRKSVV